MTTRHRKLFPSWRVCSMLFSSKWTVIDTMFKLGYAGNCVYFLLLFIVWGIVPADFYLIPRCVYNFTPRLCYYFDTLIQIHIPSLHNYIQRCMCRIHLYILCCRLLHACIYKRLFLICTDLINYAIKGYCTPYHKLACFVLYLKIINTFVKIYIIIYIYIYNLQQIV